MLWMRMALVSEGVSDDGFLSVVLQRSAQQVCPAGTQMEDVLPVRAALGPAPVGEVIGALEGHDGAFSLVVVHHDGDASPDEVRRRWIGPVRDRWRTAGHGEPVVGVVPIRETEAWALADAAALWRMLGCPRSDSTLGLPARACDLERLADPKRTLRALFERQHRWDPQYLVRLGELVALERLRELPAFRRWEDDLAEALQTLPGFTKR